MSSAHDPYSLAYWFPSVEAAGVPVPRTEIVQTSVPLTNWLDGESVPGVSGFLVALEAAIGRIGGAPCFLRTGHGSGKHRWRKTCYLSDSTLLLDNVARLVEWSHGVDMLGLPTDVWVARELIDADPVFHAFEGMPITREFRLFVEGGEVTHLQPYWPPAAIERPDEEDWAERLAAISSISPQGVKELSLMAVTAVDSIERGGGWSVDFLQGNDGQWWLIDMALAERSFRWNP
jgi:hypothetical protein